MSMEKKEKAAMTDHRSVATSFRDLTLELLLNFGSVSNREEGSISVTGGVARVKGTYFNITDGSPDTCAHSLRSIWQHDCPTDMQTIDDFLLYVRNKKQAPSLIYPVTLRLHHMTVLQRCPLWYTSLRAEHPGVMGRWGYSWDKQFLKDLEENQDE
ncbi:hypothetical protein ARMGADRAFT_1033777 [Armillaria gallica]|uniref:Uncharacterized protein n=1 Tax=Armillaria gallica TaxID=47427 RepID=A0A2H3DMX4_ARMGA|nr:hypothetical protein ARMGADRAFT_1033777 [Armillaria gallica]